ncbi:MAG TPA: DUF2637 domain-containing protein [Actinocrinis sp.]|nr:DUF2637 domain-containing protein [Actinocrinis sp.]
MTTEHHTPAAPQRVLGDSRGERRIVALIGTSVLALALTGMYVSFRTVYAYVLPYFHGTAWAVPSGVDLAILVFSAADLMLMYWDIPMPGLRLVPWAFTAATIALNWQSGGPLPIRIAHAAMPSLWVVFCEYARHVIRHRVGLVAGTRMEKIRKSRWLLAPWSTARMWRRMILWEITNYRAGLDMEADRLTRRALLELEYGRRWKRKAPATKLLPLRLGALAPADSIGELTRTGLLDLDLGGLGGVRKDVPVQVEPAAATEQLEQSDQSGRRAIEAQAPAPAALPAPPANHAANNSVNNHATPVYNGHRFNGFAGVVNGSVNGSSVNGSAASISGPEYDGDPDEQVPRFDPREVRGARERIDAYDEQDERQDRDIRDPRNARASRDERDRDGYESHRDPRDPRDPLYARDPQQFAEYGDDAQGPVAQVPDQRRPPSGYPAAPRPERTRHDLEVRFAAPPAREHPDHEEPEDDQDGDFDEFIPVETPPEPTVIIGKQRQQFEDALDRMVREGDMRILSADMRESSAAAWEAAATLDLALATERAFRYGAEYRDRIIAKGLTMEMADAMGIEYNGDQ